jgi:hypothetical protein
LLHHEYWPSQIFYLPVFFVFLKNAFKLGSLNYFCWTNPKMENGGLIGYSKSQMLDQIPDEHCPRTLFIDNKLSFPDVEFLALNEKYSFPFIAKPDKGARGYRVELIENIREFRNYHKSSKQPYLIQEYIEYPMEFGVFIVRAPDRFYVSSLIQKEFLALVGDGKSTVLDLFKNHERASKYFKKSELPAYLDRVLLDGKVILLEPIGNHSRGTKFLNANALIDAELTSVFEKTVLSMPDFYYGRFDVKAESFGELKKGNFKVMEVNGMSSEPGHIYDPTYSLERAYSDLFWHWDKMAEIAIDNKKKGYQKESIMKTITSLLDYYRNR